MVLTILKNISQWEGFSHILWKIKNVPNHQPELTYTYTYIDITNLINSSPTIHKFIGQLFRLRDIPRRTFPWFPVQLFDILLGAAAKKKEYHPSSNQPSWVIISYTSSTAQGGGGSFKNRKPIGKLGCCESGMAEGIHWWTERCLISLILSLSFSDYLPTYLSIFYVSIALSIYLSLSIFHLII